MSAEFDFINWIRSRQTVSPLVAISAGDDLAALHWPPGDLVLVGADQVLDGVHFDSAVHAPRAIGQKAMKRNLSDCAAMACLPAAAIVTFALPRGVGIDYAKELYLGVEEAGAKYECPIVGGDTGSWPGKLAISVTILGRSAGVTPVTRRGARPGDLLFVSGPVGGSILGRHMTFEPRVELARSLASAGGLHAMIDLSDGLSRDLAHLCEESEVSAIIFSELVNVHADAHRQAEIDGRPALDHALDDGEDYELLAAIAPGSPANLAANAMRLMLIGVCGTGKDLLINRNGATVPLQARAWEHTL